MKRAISITVAQDNMLWLRGQAARTTGGNVSEIVDRLITEARTVGGGNRSAARSVAGTIDLPDEDALLEAGRSVSAWFEQSLNRPLLVRERGPKKPARPRG